MNTGTPEPVICQAVKNNLYQYSDLSRQAERFTDVYVKSGDLSFPAHRLVLASYSQFFEALFQSPMREKYQGTVELNELDGESVKLLVDFMYTRSITIDDVNVFQLLPAAHFLQMNEVCNFCYEYLAGITTVENWFTVWSILKMYESDVLAEKLYETIGENFMTIAQSDNFKELSTKDLIIIMQKLDKTFVERSAIYEAVINWVRHDKRKRKTELPQILTIVGLQNLSNHFLTNIVVTDQLVRENVECLKIVMTAITNQLKTMRLKENHTKVLSIGGSKTKNKVIEIYNSGGERKSVYPDLPKNYLFSRAIKLNEYIYSIGGSSNDQLSYVTKNVYRMNLQDVELKWERVAPMIEERSSMGVAVFKDCLVVAGGVGSRFRRHKSCEVYVPALKKWQKIATLNFLRAGGELVACNDRLYALGGVDTDFCVPLVERLSDLDGVWEVINKMECSRSLFAAVSYDGAIYAFGGRHQDIFLSYYVVFGGEKCNFTKEGQNAKWKIESEMDYAYCFHAACVFNDQIFLAGGWNVDDEANNLIKCFDPSTNKWTTVGELDVGLLRHSLVAL